MRILEWDGDFSVHYIIIGDSRIIDIFRENTIVSITWNTWTYCIDSILGDSSTRSSVKDRIIPDCSTKRGSCCTGIEESILRNSGTLIVEYSILCDIRKCILCDIYEHTPRESDRILRNSRKHITIYNCVSLIEIDSIITSWECISIHAQYRRVGDIHTDATPICESIIRESDRTRRGDIDAIAYCRHTQFDIIERDIARSDDIDAIDFWFRCSTQWYGFS